MPASSDDETSGSAPKSVLGRTFVILTAFGPGESQLSLTELSERTELPKSTVHRMAGSLVQFGFLEQAHNAFRLGGTLFELGSRVPRIRTLRNYALPILAALHCAQQETVHLGVLDGFDVLFIERIIGAPPFLRFGDPGTRLPAHTNALGKALLAHVSRQVVDEIVLEGLSRLTAYTTTSASLFRDQLAAIRRGSISHDREEAQLGVATVASAIVVRGHPVAAVAISGPLGRIRFEQHGTLVKRSGEELGRALGVF
jgi:IclR family acetate operon transcriptional repressor